MRFTWDPAKDAENQRKQRVSFAVAARIFFDPLVRLRKERVIAGEQRWHALGMVSEDLLLLVVHTVHGEFEDEIRLISARKAERYEKEEYKAGVDN